MEYLYRVKISDKSANEYIFSGCKITDGWLEYEGYAVINNDDKDRPYYRFRHGHVNMNNDRSYIKKEFIRIS